MPDSLLPIQGPASQRERDLDALLSAEPGYAVVLSRRVAAALDALRAAPAPDELDGEAAARAAFRLLLVPEAGAPVPDPVYQVPVPVAQVPAPVQPSAAAGADRPDGHGSTVVLSRTAPGGPRHARPRRQVPWAGRWQVMAAACGSAAAVIVCVVALAGGFSGPSGQQGRSGPRPSPQASSASSHRVTSSVLGTATARPTPRPSVLSPGELCHQYMGYFTHPAPAANRSAENAVVKQLSKLAGGQPQIFGYCARQLGAAHGHDPGFQGGAGDPAGGNPAGHDGFGEHGTARLGGSGSAIRRQA
jgi:hypothetical protein